jgi:Cu-Zn family superoxide dismutase
MRKPLLLLLAPITAFVLMAETPPAMVPGASGEIATAVLTGADGSPKGTVRLVADGDVLTVEIAGTGLPPGIHGAHLHMVGACDAPGFTTAGGHLNPGGKLHGSMNPMGSHLGDMPNLTVAADGTGRLSARLKGAAAEVLPRIFDADGAALVIHAGPDDYATDPSGNSGARIACGVLKHAG